MEHIQSIYEYTSYVVIVALLIMTLLIVFKSASNGITPMPSNLLMQQVVMKEVKRLNNRRAIVDAGSGFGHLLFKLAKTEPNRTYIGIENSIVPYIFAVLRNKLHHILYKSDIQFKKMNLHRYKYESGSIIVCYLYPAGMQKLKQTLIEQNINQIYIISVGFAINDLQPLRITECNDLFRTKVYTYELLN